MIVKTFIGHDAKEIEERIFRNYGPDAIILTSIEISPGQVEVNFGIEEEDFVAFQNSIKSQGGDEVYSVDEEDQEIFEADGFWDEDTIPDVEYLATTNSQMLESAINKKMSAATPTPKNDQPLSKLLNRGISTNKYKYITEQLGQNVTSSDDEEQLLKIVESLIPSVNETQPLDQEKLLTISSIEGVEITSITRKVVAHLQSQGKSIRTALLTEEHTLSQEYDIINSWDELSEYISNYIHKCDHLLILCNERIDFLKQWPSAHALHFINALWKPSDIKSYLDRYKFHINSSLILGGLEETETPGSILDCTTPPIRFLELHERPLTKARSQDIAKTITFGENVVYQS